MEKTKFAIATMADERYGDAALTLAGIQRLTQFYAQFDAPVIVADGGSSENFLKNMKAAGVQDIYNVTGGLTNQLVRSMQEAATIADYVIYTEPDKLDWFNGDFSRIFADYAPGHFSPIARTDEVFSTFPVSQQNAERRLNDFLIKYAGVKGDYGYGPRVFPSSLADSLSEINQDIRWGTLTHLLIRAKERGIPFQMLYLAASCPFSQREENNPEYRNRQTAQHELAFSLATGRMPDLK